MKDKNRVYGPVPSRRLGLSLGMDLTDYKHCSLDCIYCQLKETTEKNINRKNPVSAGTLLEQVGTKIQSGPRPDFLTLAGSGEPTLYLDLGTLIKRLKDEFNIPVALITNGTLFPDPSVRKESVGADVVLPSLDAWDQASFQKINRPCKELDFDSFIEGLVSFRKEFSGQIWLETMILKGISDTAEVASKLAELAARISPERIQINTPVRPPSCPDARPVDHSTLLSLAELFTPVAEVTADFPEAPKKVSSHDLTDDEVLEMITRRPCTSLDVANGLDASSDAALKALLRLVEKGMLTKVEQHGKSYFKLAD